MTTAVRSPASRRRNARVLLYSRAALFAVLSAFALTVLTSSGTDAVSGRLGGDFPAFYAAGSIVSDGDWENLYDSDRQAAEQASLFGDDSTEGSYLYFAYPPHAAVMYRPLAALDYRLAYTIHTLIMASALVFALSLIRPLVPLVRRNFELVATASLLFYPLLRSVTGGQNTALSVLGLAAAWRLLHDDQDAAAGLVIALLLFKPQFAIPLMGVMVVSGRWRAVGTSVLGATTLWAITAGLMGSGWLRAWWAGVSDFATVDAEVNGENAVSWLGFAENIQGAGSAAAVAVAAPLIVATVAATIWAWTGNRYDLSTRVAVTAVAVVLMSPHAMFYDAGLLVLPAVWALDRAVHKAGAVVAACWVVAWSQLFATNLGFAPLFVVVVAAAVVMTRAAGGVAKLGAGEAVAAP